MQSEESGLRETSPAASWSLAPGPQNRERINAYWLSHPVRGMCPEPTGHRKTAMTDAGSCYWGVNAKMCD